MKVFILTNIPNPYRIKFWNQLGTKCDLTVAFESYNECNRSWQVSGVGDHFKPVFLKGMTFGVEFHFNPSIKKHLRNYPYDVYVMGGYAAPTDMMAINELVAQGKKFIFSADGGFAKPGENQVIADMKRRFISPASWYMSSGSACDAYLQSYGAREDQIHRYNFSSMTESDMVDTPKITVERRNATFKRLGLKNKLVIAPAGQFIHRKGIDILLDIWGHVRTPDASLMIIGNGPKKKQYEKIIRERNLQNVLIHDFIPKEKLKEFYHMADVAVFPTRYDIWGLVPPEAMSCSLPVVSSPNAASVLDLIEDDYNGYLVDLHQPITWARRIEELLEDADKNVLFGRRAFQAVRNYTIESMVDSYYDLFKRIVRENDLGSNT